MPEGPPAWNSEGDYEKWRAEVDMWQIVTELEPKKQALAVMTKLTGRARSIAMDLDGSDLNSDYGMSFLLLTLDEEFKAPLPEKMPLEATLTEQTKTNRWNEHFVEVDPSADEREQQNDTTDQEESANPSWYSSKSKEVRRVDRGIRIPRPSSLQPQPNARGTHSPSPSSSPSITQTQAILKNSPETTPSHLSYNNENQQSPVAQPPAQKSSNPLIESTANALAILLSNSGPPSESHPAPVEPSGPVDPTQLAIQRAKEVTTNLKQHMQPSVKASVSTVGPTGSQCPEIKIVNNAEGQQFEADYIINDLPARSFFVKGSTQSLIGKLCSISCTVKGRHFTITEWAKQAHIRNRSENNKPLYLKLRADTVTKIANTVRKLNQVSANYDAVGGMPSNNNYGLTIDSSTIQSRGNELEDRVYVGIDDANVEFNLKLKLTGKNNSNLGYIATNCGGRVSLRGKGSGYRDLQTGMETTDKLHMFICHPNVEGINKARGLCESLIETVRGEYSTWLRQKNGYPAVPPAVPSVSAAPALPPGTPVTVPPPIIPVPVPVPVPVPALPPGPAMIPSSSFSHAGMVPVGALGISPPTQGVSMLSQQMRPVGVALPTPQQPFSIAPNGLIVNNSSSPALLPLGTGFPQMHPASTVSSHAVSHDNSLRSSQYNKSSAERSEFDDFESSETYYDFENGKEADEVDEYENRKRFDEEDDRELRQEVGKVMLSTIINDFDEEVPDIRESWPIGGSQIEEDIRMFHMMEDQQKADGNPRMRSPSPVKIEDKPRRKPRSKNWDKKPWDEGPSQKMGGLELQLKSRSRSPSPKSQFPWSKGSRSPKRSRAKSPSRRRSRSRSRERRRDSSRDRHSSEERDYSNTDTSNSSSQNRSRRKFTESVPSKWDFKTATSHWDEGDEDSPTDPSKPRTKRKFQEGPATFKTAGVRKFAEDPKLIEKTKKEAEKKATLFKEKPKDVFAVPISPAGGMKIGNLPINDGIIPAGAMKIAKANQQQRPISSLPISTKIDQAFKLPSPSSKPKQSILKMGALSNLSMYADDSDEDD